MPKVSSPEGLRRGRGCFLCDEAGAGSAFALFGLVICMMIAGAAIDFGNAWRHREILRLSADVAAHAGASVLARGGDRMAALAVATGATELNTPGRRYGQVISDPFVDIQALSYDPASNMLTPGGEPNAISVHLQRSDRVRNPVPTFLLSLVGLPAWEISATSVVAVVPTERCDSGDGIYAQARITLEGKSAIGSDVCLHSQSELVLKERTVFSPQAGVSLPDLSNCRGNCNEIVSPGFAAAAAEANLVMPDPVSHIDRLYAGFSDAEATLSEETEFFAAHALSDDLSALDELGIDTRDLKRGDVVALTQDVFERARALPSGLVYDVSCSPSGPDTLTIGRKVEEIANVSSAEAEAIQETAFSEHSTGALDDGYTDGLDGSELSTEPEESLPAIEPFVLRGIALMTNCRIQFTASADVQGALILSMRQGEGVAVSAEEGASAGDPRRMCTSSLQTLIMAKGSVEVPAGFTNSNVAFVTGGGAGIMSHPEGLPTLHRGLSIHARGAVHLDGEHSFEACGTGLDILLPELSMIRYVLPTDPLVMGNNGG